jgi:hypothetical protein
MMVGCSHYHAWGLTDRRGVAALIAPDRAPAGSNVLALRLIIVLLVNVLLISAQRWRVR